MPALPLPELPASQRWQAGYCHHCKGTLSLTSAWGPLESNQTCSVAPLMLNLPGSGTLAAAEHPARRLWGSRVLGSCETASRYEGYLAMQHCKPGGPSLVTQMAARGEPRSSSCAGMRCLHDCRPERSRQDGQLGC